MKHQILALKIEDIKKNALNVQELLTENGCLIQARLGFHESSGMICSNTGLVILLLQDQPNEVKAFKDALEKIDGVKAALVIL